MNNPPQRRSGIMGRIVGAAASIPRAMERAVPTTNVPSPDQRRGNFVSQAYTYLTAAGGEAKQLYTANIEWSRVKLFLETAGPVAVAFKQSFTPVLSGKGDTLPTGIWFEVDVAKGNVLWIASPTVNRVKVIIQPLPWMEQILGGVVRGADAIVKMIASATGKGG